MEKQLTTTISQLMKASEHLRYKNPYANGKISHRIDEHDKVVIKRFCELMPMRLKSFVDLSKNKCAIHYRYEEKEMLLGHVEKFIYHKTFEVLKPFKLYTNRNPTPGISCHSITILPGTRIFLSEDYLQFWIEVPTPEEWVKVERWIVVKNTMLRQVRSLVLINHDIGLGKEDGMKQLDLVECIDMNQSEDVKRLLQTFLTFEYDSKISAVRS